jgi:RHS repeat-associated protein
VRGRYTGQQYLGGLNLYHYKARCYSPSLGRFLQTDPIGTADDLNLYAYVGNNPVNFSDPTGLAAADLRLFAGKIGGSIDNWWDSSVAGFQSETWGDTIERSIQGLNPAMGAGVLGLRGLGRAADVTYDAARVVPKSWTAARNAYWKANGPSGKAPTREVLVRDTRTGQVYRRTETKELDHIVPQRSGGSHDPSNLREVWPTEHAAIDPYRRTGYEVIRVLSGP